MDTVIYHGTPLTPRPALEAMAGRAFCVSFYRPDDIATVDRIGSQVMLDNGAFSFWKQAMADGREWDDADRDWRPFYAWIDARLWWPGRWAVIPDRPGAPSQLNDALLNDWPFGRSRGAPLYHMDAPVSRLGRLCEQYDRVCLGWIGHPKLAPVGCAAYRRKMDEIAAMFGNSWHPVHMMRGVAVARDYPFRQRRQHESRAKWPSARPARRQGPRRAVARPQSLRRSIGGQA